MSLDIDQLMTRVQSTPSITNTILDRWLERADELSIDKRLALVELLLRVTLT